MIGLPLCAPAVAHPPVGMSLMAASAPTGRCEVLIGHFLGELRLPPSRRYSVMPVARKLRQPNFVCAYGWR